MYVFTSLQQSKDLSLAAGTPFPHPPQKKKKINSSISGNFSKYLKTFDLQHVYIYFLKTHRFSLA